MRNIFLPLLVVLYALSAFAVPTALTPVVPTETVNEAGFTTTNGATGHSIKNPGGDIVLVIKNETAASAAVATVSVQNSSITVPGFGTVTKSDAVCTLAAGENCVVGPFPTRFWNDGNSNLQLTYTGDGSSAMSVLPLKP